MVAKKKSPAKSTTKRKTTTKSHVKSKSLAIAGSYRTFRVMPDYPSFFEARVTRQTFYWSVLLLFIVIMQLIIVATVVNASLTFATL